MRTLLMIAVLPSAAMADLPRIDGSDDCRSMADHVQDEAVFAECMDVEEQSLALLTEHWDEVPEDVRANCSEIVNSDLPLVATYQALALCVARETDDRGLTLSFELPPRIEEMRN